MITDLEESYAIFTYNCDQLQWDGLDSFPTIGFNSPSDGTFRNHPFTGQMGATEIACSPNPTCNNVIYRVSAREDQSMAEEQKRMCVEWYLDDLRKFSDSRLTFLNIFAPHCPCQFFQALVDPFFVRISTDKMLTFCFRRIFIFFGSITECCYSSESLTFGALVTETENGGSLLLAPFTSENNRIPQSLCCSDEVGMCNLYYERRPGNLCFRYFPPRFSK